MIIGIDFGATFTDIVLVEKNKIKKTFSLKPVSPEKIEIELKKLKLPLNKIKQISITGGKSMKFKKKTLLKIPVKKIPELKAAALGGLALSGKKSALIISLGTGTAIINAQNKKFTHLGGTGISGGTLLGLSHLLLKTHNLKKIKSMAKKGSLKKVDLQIIDVVGEKLSFLPANATASNFAKLKKYSKNDLALGIINLIGEANGMMIYFAAQKTNQKNIVLIGRLALFKPITKRIQSTLSLFGKKAVISKKPETATAYGAVLALNSQKLN